MSADRLQKILSRAGVASRRASEDLIREGRVTVNGQVAELGSKADPENDAIKVDGKRIAVPTRSFYVLLNKPTGHVSTRNDPEGRPTVLDLLSPRLRERVFPVGRLDFDTEGLMLLTDDGDFAHRIAHPRYGCEKVYEVKVKGEPQRAQLDKLRQGIRLEGRLTAPARIEKLRRSLGPREAKENTWWTVILGEGRTRQIREMFFRIGHPVTRLRRVAIGGLRDPHLAVGKWRELTEDEVEALRKRTKKRKRRGAAAGKSPIHRGQRAANRPGGDRPKGRGPKGKKSGRGAKKGGPPKKKGGRR